MTRASDSMMDALHGLAASTLMDELRRAKARAEAEPDNPEAAIPPQTLSQVLKFLSNNGVNTPASSKRAKDLEAELADLDIDLDEVVLTDRHPN